MFMTAHAATPSRRWWCALALCAIVAIAFWSFSRYPDLTSEWRRAGADTLLDRNVGAISKTEMMQTGGEQPVYERILKTSANWVETNIKGMTFGILFGSCLLVLLRQSAWIRHQGDYSRARSLLSGLALGTPLGVCANCATPIGLSMYRAGIRLETVLAAMVASPSLNPLGLAIVFGVFPLSMALLKVGAALILLLVCIPLILRLFGPPGHRPGARIDLPLGASAASPNETWAQACAATLRMALTHLWYVIKWTVPFMAAVAVLAALLTSFYPIEQIIFLSASGGWAIVVAAVVGALLPAPMFVDIILVLSLLSFGMAQGPATAMLISLGPVSIYASAILWRFVSRKVALALLACGALLGVAGGFAQDRLADLDKAKPAPMTRFVVAATHDLSEPARLDVLESVQNFIHAGASWGDYDGDGDDDLWVSAARGGRLYRNDGAEGFVERTAASGIQAFPQSSGGVWADYDGDGDLDLLVLYYGFLKDDKWYAHTNMLWRNDGYGAFTDVTREAGLFAPSHTTAAAWADYDGDGDLDLYVSNYGVMVGGPTANARYDIRFVRSQPNQLYRNNGDGSFTDVAEAAGVAGRAVKTRSDYSAMAAGRSDTVGESCFCSFQPVWFDYDNDGHIDIFVANDFGASQLYRNLGDGRFVDMAAEAGIDKYSTGMGVAVTDIDQNGFLDIYETTIEDNPLWINNGDGTFGRVRLSRLLDDRERYGWGVAFLDFDNDGLEDLAIANGLTVTGDIKRLDEFRFSNRNINSLYRSMGDGTYANVLQDVGLANSLVSRGLAVSDFNQDGYPDLYVVNKVGENVLYASSGGVNNWIAVKLRGRRNNRDGIGAVITVHANGRSRTQLVTAGESYASQSSLWRTFGLGPAERADRIVVKWPDGHIQELRDVPGRQRLLVDEGDR